MDMKKMGPRPPPGRSNTRKSGARWSLPITFFLLFMAAQQSTTAGSPSTGRIIIVGGLKSSESSSVPYSETLFGPDLPPFPFPVYGNTLSRVGDSVYSCGGSHISEYKTFKECWVIDTVTKGATWHSFDIPWALSTHSALVVQDEIWFFHHSDLHILDTKNPANKPRTISLEVIFGGYVCAVAHGSKTFLIAAGHQGNEVHVNSDRSKPGQWKRLSTLLQARIYPGCHEFGGEVFVTGGYSSRNTGYFWSSVEAISVVNGSVRSIGSMGGGRGAHRMAIIEGRLAVLGGNSGPGALKTIETYDEKTNSWETMGRTLADQRYLFGLTQFLP